MINDPPHNRMSLEFMDALEAEVERVAGDPGARAIVIRGSGTENLGPLLRAGRGGEPRR